MKLRRFCYLGSAFLLALAAYSWIQQEYFLAIVFGIGMLIGAAGSLLFFVLEAVKKENAKSGVDSSIQG